MRMYQFQALNANGKKVRGAIPANSKDRALYNLKLKNLHPIHIKPQKFSWLMTSDIWTVEWAKDMSFFLKQELSLVESLQASKLRLGKKQIQIIDMLLAGLYAGQTLSQIISEHQFFSKLFIGLLSVAEATGQYAQAFEDYALLRAEEIEFFKQLRSNLQYPIVLAIIIFSMIIAFSEFLLPTSLDFFRNNNFEQHLTTTLFIHFAELLKNFLTIFTNLPVVITVITSCYMGSKIKRIKYIFSWLSIKFPIFGPIYLMTIQSFYLKSFSILLKRGHHVIQAVSYTTDILQNTYLKSHALQIEHIIKHDGKISAALTNLLKLPESIEHLLLTGEKTSQVSTYSNICAETLKNIYQGKLQKIIAWTGPFLISIMGIVMIWMVVAIVVPLYDQVARMD